MHQLQFLNSLAIGAVFIVAYMSDTSSEGSRLQRGDRGVQRLEKIRSKHTGEQRHSDPMPGRTPSEETAAEQPLPKGASADGLSMDHGHDAAQARRQTEGGVKDLECSALEHALKEQVYRLAGQWEQGAQRLASHLEDALHELADVRQQENDLLKRRVELCHRELDDQVAQLERSYHLKVEQCKQQLLARIADQRADCEMAIKAKAESLLGVLEQVDAVPIPSPSGQRLRDADRRMASPCPDHSLAHAACPCYDQNDEFQYSGGDAQPAESWTAMTPPMRRLNYLVPNPSPERRVSLSVQRYMHKTTDRQEWWKPARLAVPEGRKRMIRKPVPQHSSHDDIYDSPVTERLAGFGIGFRKYRPCSCRTRAGMLAPRPPLRLSHLLEQSDDDS